MAEISGDNPVQLVNLLSRAGGRHNVGWVETSSTNFTREIILSDSLQPKNTTPDCHLCSTGRQLVIFRLSCN